MLTMLLGWTCLVSPERRELALLFSVSTFFHGGGGGRRNRFEKSFLEYYILFNKEKQTLVKDQVLFEYFDRGMRSGIMSCSISWRRYTYV